MVFLHRYSAGRGLRQMIDRDTEAGVLPDLLIINKRLFMKILILALLFSGILYSQTISFTPTYHVGNYGEGSTELGKMEPTLDWSMDLYVPLTEKFAVTPSIYYYFAEYKDYEFEQSKPLIPNPKYYETFWYIGITFEYTFSSEPLFK